MVISLIFPPKKKKDIEESDYSDKVKLTKLMEIADTHRCLSYKEISDLMKVKYIFLIGKLGGPR
jgi:hypothetical protein